MNSPSSHTFSRGGAADLQRHRFHQATSFQPAGTFHGYRENKVVPDEILYGDHTPGNKTEYIAQEHFETREAAKTSAQPRPQQAQINLVAV